MALDTSQLKRRANDAISGFTNGQKAIVVIAVVALLAGGMVFAKWASKPSYTPLFSNLDGSDAASITNKLASEKVSYQLTDGGKTVLVPASKVDQLRIDMSGAGLPANSASGYALL